MSKKKKRRMKSRDSRVRWAGEKKMKMMVISRQEEESVLVRMTIT